MHHLHFSFLAQLFVVLYAYFPFPLPTLYEQSPWVLPCWVGLFLRTQEGTFGGGRRPLCCHLFVIDSKQQQVFEVNVAGMYHEVCGGCAGLQMNEARRTLEVSILIFAFLFVFRFWLYIYVHTYTYTHGRCAFIKFHFDTTLTKGCCARFPKLRQSLSPCKYHNSLYESLGRLCSI